MDHLLLALLVSLIGAELIKGLSANGTPPVLQSFRWQMDLAYFMWRGIGWMRAVLGAAIVVVLALNLSGLMVALALFLGSVWGGVYWLFNHYWVGRVKFQPISQMVFKTAAESAIAEDTQVLGVDLDGVQKAYPVPMLFYHHQMRDTVGQQAIWATYCGLCRSGRIYDAQVAGQALTFGLIGAITYNAVFQDHATGSWWRQETGEAAKGPLAATQLRDFWVEQMSLKHWLSKHPGSLILQEDPKFVGKYRFLTKLLAYEASLPGWHRQETPPLVLGLEIAGHARAYDFDQLKRRRLVNDQVGDTALLILSDGEASGFAYARDTHEFEMQDGTFIDQETGSTWNVLGRCTAGTLAGQALTPVRSYQQFLRAWIEFHPHTTFYEF